jgi:hypothetical protein
MEAAASPVVSMQSFAISMAYNFLVLTYHPR